LWAGLLVKSFSFPTRRGEGKVFPFFFPPSLGRNGSPTSASGRGRKGGLFSFLFFFDSDKPGSSPVQGPRRFFFFFLRPGGGPPLGHSAARSFPFGWTRTRARAPSRSHHPPRVVRGKPGSTAVFFFFFSRHSDSGGASPGPRLADHILSVLPPPSFSPPFPVDSKAPDASPPFLFFFFFPRQADLISDISGHRPVLANFPSWGAGQRGTSFFFFFFFPPPGRWKYHGRLEVLPSLPPSQQRRDG